MSTLEHIILFGFLFVFFWIWAKNNYNIKDGYRFWISAIVPILFYSFIVGSRYGWGADYEWYKYRFEKALTFKEEQIGFKYLNIFLYNLGFSYVGAYITYSLFFSIAGFILLRSYKRASKYMYVLFIPATLIFTSGIIRQGIALSFVFLMVYFLNKQKYVYAISTIYLGMLIHSSIIITALGIGLLYFTYNKPISWKITVPLYLIFTYIIDPSVFKFISPYIESSLHLNNKFQGYIDNSERWFGEEGIRRAFEQSALAKILSSLFHLSIIILGYIALILRHSKKINYLYNATVIGVIMYRMFFVFEIMRRLAEPFVMFYYVVLGYAFYVFFELNLKRIVTRYQMDGGDFINISKLYYIKKIGVFFILFYLVMFWGRFILFNGESDFFLESVINL